MLTARCRTSKVGQGCDVCSRAEKTLRNAYVLQNVIFSWKRILANEHNMYFAEFQNFYFVTLVDIYVEFMNLWLSNG